MDEALFREKAKKLNCPRGVLEELLLRKRYLLVPDDYPLKIKDCYALRDNLWKLPVPEPEIPAISPSQTSTQGRPQVLVNPNSGPTQPIYVVVGGQTGATKPVAKTKAKKNPLFQLIIPLLVFVVLGLSAYLFVKISGYKGGSPSLAAITLPGKMPDECGVPNSLFVDFKTADNEALYPAKVPTLTDEDSYICFDSAKMATFLSSTLTAGDKQVDGRTALASYIVNQTAERYGKNLDATWIRTVFDQVYSVLDPNSFQSANEAGFQYVKLPGIKPAVAQVNPTATQPVAAIPESTATPQATATSAVNIIPPTNTPLSPTTAPPTVTPTPLPRPTLEQFRATVTAQLATAMVQWNVTPLPTLVNTLVPPNTVTLDYYVANNLNGGAACSPWDRNYGERWAMDNVVTLIIGIGCMDGEGRMTYVQIPDDVAARHVVDVKLPQIFVTKYPVAAHGPAFPLASGYFIQPFK